VRLKSTRGSNQARREKPKRLEARTSKRIKRGRPGLRLSQEGSSWGVLASLAPRSARVPKGQAYPQNALPMSSAEPTTTRAGRKTVIADQAMTDTIIPARGSDLRKRSGGSILEKDVVEVKNRRKKRSRNKP